MFAIVSNDLQYAAANKHEARKEAYHNISENILSLLNEFRLRNLPVIHLILTADKNDPVSLSKPDKLSFIKGTSGHKILEDVHSDSDIIIEKPKDSGFFNTNLEEILREKGVKCLLMVGMQTQICIQTTAADAHFRGFRVVVPSDAVCSTRNEDTLQSLKWLADYCAEVRTTNEIISQFDRYVSQDNVA